MGSCLCEGGRGTGVSENGGGWCLSEVVGERVVFAVGLGRVLLFAGRDVLAVAGGREAVLFLVVGSEGEKLGVPSRFHSPAPPWLLAGRGVAPVCV